MPSGQTGGLIDQSLRANMQLISDEGAGHGLIIREYRAPTLKPAEIEHPQVIQAGSISLRGFSLEQSRTALTLILYWQPGGLTTDTAFIHITGATNPATGTPLWTQDDHPPQFSVIAPRDVYHMTLTNLPPGTYQLMFGLYDSNSGNRHPLTDGQGVALGDNVTLISIVIPLRIVNR